MQNNAMHGEYCSSKGQSKPHRRCPMKEKFPKEQLHTFIGFDQVKV